MCARQTDRHLPVRLCLLHIAVMSLSSVNYLMFVVENRYVAYVETECFKCCDTFCVSEGQITQTIITKYEGINNELIDCFSDVVYSFRS
jgi:hypothetical protein